MIPGRQYTPIDWVLAVWQRRWIVLVSFALATAASVVVAGRLPDRYRSMALIVTVPQGVSQDYVRATIASKTQMADRLPAIREQILSRARLEPIVMELDLYADLRLTKPMEWIVERMRNDTNIEIVGNSDSIRVSYDAGHPQTAMQVTERLAAVTIEENLRDRESLARATSEFLESQLEDARTRLVERESRLESYRLKYGAELPTQLQSNIQAIQNTELQIQALNEALNRDGDRRLLVSRQLADLQSEHFLPTPGGTAPAAPIAAPDPSIAVQLDAALGELATLEQQWTAAHPDVIRKKRQITDLQSRARMEATAPGSEPEVPARPLTATEIAKRNRIKELKTELESVDRQIANRVAEEKKLRGTIELYRARVDAVPTRESELAALTRDYDTLQTQYRVLLAKREDAKVAEELERRQVGEQFKIADPPRRPERPTSPNRAAIDIAGALAGILFGIAIALLLEIRDKSLKKESDVLAALDLPVLGMIPLLVTGAEWRRRRWQQAAISVGIGTVLVTCATAVWLTFRV